MFDFGFQELILIFVVALVVLGPKRMQQLAGTVGKWVGKARGMARQFREQLETEINLEDLDKAAKTAAPVTPVPMAGMDGSPASPAAPGVTPENANYPYGGTYPYAAPQDDAGATPAAGSGPAPQPGDDTYSHAHAAGNDPMPYLPPEAEGFGDAPPPVPLDSPMNPDHGTQIAHEPPPEEPPRSA